MFLGHVRHEEGEEADDEVEEELLQGGRKHEDDAAGGDPDRHVGYENGEDAARIPAGTSHVGEDGAEAVVVDGVENNDNEGNCPDGAVEELVADHFDERCGKIAAGADDAGEESVPDVDFESFPTPEGEEGGSLSRVVTVAGGGAEFEINEGDDAADESGADDAVEEVEPAELGAQRGELVDGFAQGGDVVITEDEREGEEGEDDRGEFVGVEGAESGTPGRFGGLFIHDSNFADRRASRCGRVASLRRGIFVRERSVVLRGGCLGNFRWIGKRVLPGRRLVAGLGAGMLGKTGISLGDEVKVGVWGGVWVRAGLGAGVFSGPTKPMLLCESMRVFVFSHVSLINDFSGSCL